MKNRRKKFLLQPKFQLSLIGYFMGLTFLLSSVFYLAVINFFYKFQSLGVEAGFPSDHIFFSFLSEQKGHMDLIFFGATFVVLTIMVLGGLFISHKISGPIHNLKNYMSQYPEKRNTGKFKLRTGDFFQDLPEAVNTCLTKIENEKHTTDKAA